MKRKILSVLICMLLMISVVGCGKKNANDSDVRSESENSKDEAKDKDSEANEEGKAFVEAYDSWLKKADKLIEMDLYEEDSSKQCISLVDELKSDFKQLCKDYKSITGEELSEKYTNQFAVDSDGEYVILNALEDMKTDLKDIDDYGFFENHSVAEDSVACQACIGGFGDIRNNFSMYKTKMTTVTSDFEKMWN